MKLAIVLCAVLGLSFGAVLPHGGQQPLVHYHDARNLGDLLQELLSLIPLDKVLEIYQDHLQNDPEVQEAVKYLKSDEFKKIVTTVQAMPEFNDFVKFLYDSGLDIYTYLNFINDILGLPHINPPTRQRLVAPKTIMSMVFEILSVLPIQDIQTFYHEKVENDPDFLNLLARMRSPEFKKIVDTLRAMPEYQDLLNRLREKGVPVDEILQAVDGFFGWGRKTMRATNSLGDLFDQLMDLIPKEQVLQIILDHVQNDPEVQEAVAYMKSEDFRTIVTTVQDLPAFSEFVQYLYESGLDIYTYVNDFNNLFGLPTIKPPTVRMYYHTRSILTMVNEILAVLPLDEIKQFYHDKLENNPDFINLLDRLKSPEFQTIIDTMHALPEYQDMLNRLQSHGIDVVAIQKAIDDFFGWGSRSLRLGTHLDDLFKEFVALIPLDKILGIIAAHIQNDPEVQEAVAFLKSPEFAKIVEAVDNNPAFKDLLDFIYNAGVDIYAYINFLHGIFNIPPIVPPRRQSRTILGMIDEILAVLPLQEMQDFYNNKLKNDPDFMALLAKLMSPEFAQLVADVKAMPEYQDMLERLKSHGIDVAAIQKAIDDFFGWGSRSIRLGTHLDDLFKEFVALIPIDKVLGIIATHIQNDPEVQEAVAFLKSPEFAKIVEAVDNNPAYMDLLDYIYKAGVDIYSYVNLLHNIFGIPPIVPPRRQSRTILGMIDEILAVLPLQEMKDFYNNKLKNDPDYLALLAKLMSPEFAQLVADVKAMPEYQDMLDRLKANGIDVAAIQKAIDDFFHWGSRSLRLGTHLDDLFKEFVALIPIDKVLGIIATHIQNDPEVQEAVAFLKSPEFAKIVEAVDNNPAYMDLLDFIYKAGVDIYSYVNLLHNIFGIPPIVPPRRQSRTILGMIDEILAVLPLQEMQDFYNNKLKNDPDFMALLAKLMSPEFAQLVADVKAMPEYQDMLERLKSHGIDVAAIQKAIDDFFGWGSRSIRLGTHLDDLFKEFVALIPIDKVLGIIATHIQNDPEVQEAVAFLKSPEFAKIVEAVDNNPAYMDLLDYIYKAGVDIYSYVNLLHNIFGIPPIVPPRRQSRTILGMIDEILAVLPLQEMKDFYNNKLKNDPDYLALLAKLMSPEFAQLVADVKAMPEYQDMLDRLKANGIDVAAIQKAIDDFFHWGSRSLRLGTHLDDLFKEFAALIPIDKILGIVANHIQNDPEVQEAVAFLKSPEFAKIVEAVDNNPAYMDLLDFIYKAGVDIYSYVNLLHNIFGIPPIVPPRRQSRTILGMIDEILAVLPLQEMQDFYNNKLKNDPDFMALLAKLMSPEFAQLVADVKAMPEYQDMLERLKSHGIDVAAIQKAIDDFFGWGSRSIRLGTHLDDLFKEFVALIPIDKVLGIIATHIQNDPEVQEAVAFLKSPEFAKIVEAVDNNPAYMDLLDYIYKAGVDIYSYVNLLHNIFGIPPIVPPRRQSRTILGMIDEILAVLPLQEMKDFYNNKLKNDPDYLALLAKLMSPEFAQLVADVKAMPEYQDMLDRLKDNGIDVAAIQKAIDDFFHWGSRSLRLGTHLDDLFKEFAALIPIDKILGIVATHIQNDPEVQEAVAFLKSPEFAKIVEAVDNNPAYMDLLDFLYKAGIDIYSYVNLLHDIFGIPPIVPPRRHSRTILGMIDEILAVLPLQEMQDFYNNKLKNDPDFMALLAKLMSPEFAQLVADVKAMPEYQDMLTRLKDHGIDVAAIQKAIDDFFGWGSRSLRLGTHLDDLFKEFAALIPIDKILGIVATHIQNDPEVQEAVAFLKSPEFAKIVEAVDNNPAYMDLLDFLYKAGIDIYSYVNLLHDIFGIPPIVPPRRHSRTILGMIDEILAVLPLQEMQDFYNNKLKNDPDFLALLAKLMSPEFAQLVADVKAMPEYQDMLTRLKDHGIDVAAIQKAIDDFFGWGSRSLRLGTHLDDLFKEFVALIPIDKIIGIVATHIQNDPEVQEAVAFLKSPEFAKIVEAVDNNPAFKDLLDFIYKAGIDIYSYINLVHDILGLPHVNPPLYRRQSRTLLGMIDEILAVLPLQEMQDFYNTKLKNDPDFLALLAKLMSPEFAQLVADVKAMPEYQDMLTRLKDHGIDVAAIQKEIDDFFGWGF